MVSNDLMALIGSPLTVPDNRTGHLRFGALDLWIEAAPNGWCVSQSLGLDEDRLATWRHEAPRAWILGNVGLSVRLRTFDNMLIRIPNETMIKSAVTTVTAFPIRRMDVSVGVAYKEDVERVMALLKEIADGIPQVLDEPEPFILFKGFGDSALEFTLGVWIAKLDFVTVRNLLLPRIKTRFDAEGIEIPFPHRSLYARAASAPFPIRIVSDSKDAPACNS